MNILEKFEVSPMVWHLNRVMVDVRGGYKVRVQVADSHSETC